MIVPSVRVQSRVPGFEEKSLAVVSFGTKTLDVETFFRYFGYYWQDRDRSVIIWCSFWPYFLKRSTTLAIFQSSGKLLETMVFLNIYVNDGEIA